MKKLLLILLIPFTLISAQQEDYFPGKVIAKDSLRTNNSIEFGTVIKYKGGVGTLNQVLISDGITGFKPGNISSHVHNASAITEGVLDPDRVLLSTGFPAADGTIIIYSDDGIETRGLDLSSYKISDFATKTELNGKLSLSGGSLTGSLNTVGNINLTATDNIIQNTAGALDLRALGDINVGYNAGSNFNVWGGDSNTDFQVAVGGNTTAYGNIKAIGGYLSADGSIGGTATTGGVVFKDGLYISGEISENGGSLPDPGGHEGSFLKSNGLAEWATIQISDVSGLQTTLNDKLSSEVDGSVSNELQNLTYSSGTLSISNGNSVNITGFEPTISKSTGYLSWTGSQWAWTTQTTMEQWINLTHYTMAQSDNNFAPYSHGHSIADVTGLQDAINNIWAALNYYDSIIQCLDGELGSGCY